MQSVHRDSKSSRGWAAAFFPRMRKSGRPLCVGVFRLVLILSLVSGGLLGSAAPRASAAIPREDEAASPAGVVVPARVSSPAAPGVSVSKTVLSPAGRNVFYAGETVTFQVAVTNTGTTTVSYLPQHDEYGAECLRFLPKADPPESFEGPGLIQWYDLTFAKGIDLAPGAVFTSTMKFLVVGPVTGQSASGYNTARVSGALDANSDPVPPAESTLNFTCSQRPSLTVDKSFVTPQNRTVLLTGETITFKAVVTNTGSTTLGFIPQLDLYDTSCLTFLPKASPPESMEGGGLIQWYDLTFDNGRDLPPGQAFTTTMNFVVTGPASGAILSGANTVQVNGALDVFGSPVPSAQDTVQYTCAAPASIGDYVWEDMNGDGRQNEPASAGRNGVTVKLLNASGTVIATTVTANDGGGNPGYYLFANLAPGTYAVEFVAPAGYVFTTPNADGLGISGPANSDADRTTGRTAQVTLAGGDAVRYVDAGLYRPASLGDFIFLDANGNGVQDPGETTGIHNVPISATNVGTGVVYSATSVNGAYLISNLPPGDYLVSVPATFNSLQRTTPSPMSVTLTSGQAYRDADFGYVFPTAVALVNFTAEPGPAGVALAWQVRLHDGTEAPEFHVWRAMPGGAWKRVTVTPVAAGASDGHIAGYSYTDAAVEAGATYLYELRSSDGDTFGPWQVTVGNPQHRLFLPAVLR